MAYSEVFDKAFIITTHKYLEPIKKIIPSWWGIYEILDAGDSYSFKCRRDGKRNEGQNAFTIAQLLWKAEALDLAAALLQTNLKPSFTKKKIYQAICESCTQKQLSKKVLRYLKKRDNWRSDRA